MCRGLQSSRSKPLSNSVLPGSFPCPLINQWEEQERLFKPNPRYGVEPLILSPALLLLLKFIVPAQGTSPLLCSLGTALLGPPSFGSIMSWQQIQELFCLLLFPESSLLTSSSNKPWIDFSYTRQLAALCKTKGISHPAKRASGEIRVSF